MSELQVELQYLDGCANAALADKLLESVLADLAPGVGFQRVEVKDEDQGRDIGFHGSPTIRINGVDLDGTNDPGTGFS